MTETKPLSSCSISKDDVVAMAHEDTSLKHVIKTEEVDLKPDYLVNYSDEDTGVMTMDEQTENGYMESHNDSNVASNTNVHVKEEIISQDNNDEPEICQDEEIKEFNKQDVEVKSEVDADDGVVQISEYKIPKDLKTEVKLEQLKGSDTEIYSEDNKNNNCNDEALKFKENGQEPNIDGTINMNKKKKMYVCNDCSYKSVNGHNFIRHRKTHAENQYACSVCEYVCTLKANLTKHLKSEHNIVPERPFSCHICQFTTTSKSNLTKHLIKHTDVKPFSCDLCEYKCRAKEDLKRHMRKHTNEKPFACIYCDKKFKEKSSLTSHLRIHSGVKPFSCQHCDYKCSSSSALKQHIGRIHIGDKRFPCKYCDYKFINSTELRYHTYIHTGEKPFTCEYCEAKFRTSSHHQRHVRRKHTGEKLHSCPYCHYKAVTNDNLTRHIRIHTGEKPFSCELCDYKSVCKYNFKKHVKRHEY